MFDLKRKVLHSVKWTFTSQIARESTQFFATILLARLLSPKDYGLVGMAVTVTGFMQILNTLGFRSALIQKKDLGEDHYSTAFWTTLALSGTFCGLTIACAHFVASFYGEPAVEKILSISSLGFLIVGLNTVHLAILEKGLDFRRVTMVELTVTCVSGAVSVVMALRGFGAWSLVIGSLSGQLASVPVAWWIIRWRPSLNVTYAAFRDLFGFGIHLTGAGILNYAIRNTDNLVVGRFLGPAALGYYAMAYNLMLKPLQYVSENISRVMFPAFSQIRGEKERTVNAYLEIVQGISLITFPMMTGLMFIAPEFISLIYGPKWSPAIPVFQVLCLLGAIQSIGTTVGTIYLSQGRADLQFKVTLVIAPVFVAAYLIGVNWGIIGVAICYTTVSAGIWLWTHMIANRLIELDLKRFLVQMAPSAISSLLMFICLSLLRIGQMEFFPYQNREAILSFFIFAGIATYILALYAINPVLARKIREFIRS